MIPDNKSLCADIIAARAIYQASPTPPHKRALVAAINRTVTANMGLVNKIAFRFRRWCRSLTPDDLVQEGALGLLRALDDFDCARNVTLGTYAGWWVRAFIRRAIDQQDSEVRIPVGILETKRQLGFASVPLRGQFGREPTAAEFALATGLPETQIRHAMSVDTTHPASLDEPRGTGDSFREFAMVDMMAADTMPPDGDSLRSERERIARDLLASLPPRERTVLEMRTTDHTLDDTGKSLGVTRERARQLEAKALKRLRRTVRLQKGLADLAS